MAKSDNATGFREIKPEADLKLSGADKRVSAGEIERFNLDLKKKYRTFKKGDTLPFPMARILPVLIVRNESFEAPDGTVMGTSKEIPDARGAIHKFRESVLGEDNKVASQPVPIRVPIPGKTTAGPHISRGFTSEDLITSILLDPNWCVSYYIWPMTEAEAQADEETESSPEYAEAVERRKAISDEVRAGNHQQALV